MSSSESKPKQSSSKQKMTGEIRPLLHASLRIAHVACLGALRRQHLHPPRPREGVLPRQENPARVFRQPVAPPRNAPSPTFGLGDQLRYAARESTRASTQLKPPKTGSHKTATGPREFKFTPQRFQIIWVTRAAAPSRKQVQQLPHAAKRYDRQNPQKVHCGRCILCPRWWHQKPRGKINSKMRPVVETPFWGCGWGVQTLTG